MFLTRVREWFEAVGGCFNGECTYRFFAAADAKGACVETSACGFKLHKRFVPIEETAFFGWDESGKV